ncbi:MarR family transcriptional regulator [Halorhabdus amylolytica]|uniref:MarR family transcriptional regulator n=1 Tax=Halorhabdus amylolytica TaxID=2559573 RepID=UPI0010AA94AA|nr:helix-turn-helix domain-containing protein [Halorhabdus amylolytica]
MYTVCGEKSLKTLLAIEPGDTIVEVARKIDENRGTIRRIVDRLEADGYVEYDDGLFVVDESVRETGLQLLAASAAVSPPSISDAYVLPQFADMNFAFTGIDAVYVWTRGGYQVARDPDDYPLFIAIEAADMKEWNQFFGLFDISVSQERRPRDELNGPLQVVIDPREAIDSERVDGRPVVSLDETVEFARHHYATFQSALDTLAQIYDDIDVDQ